MKKWLPLTYKPKIIGVREGKIRTTIRVGERYSVGDEIAFHGWEGIPRHSKWSWRTPYFKLVEIIPIRVFKNGFEGHKTFHNWASPLANLIALRDGIVPDKIGATAGETLGRLMNSMHVITDKGLPAQILRW